MKKVTVFNFTIYLLLMLIVSCNSQNREAEETSVELSYPYHVDLIEGIKNKVDYFLLSDIADSIRFVPLETSEKCLIGQVNRVELDGDNVFIYTVGGQTDSYYFRFNTNGEFLNTIGRIGRGPGEYLASSFSLDIEKKRVVIFRWFGGPKDFIAFNYDGSYHGKCSYPLQSSGVTKFEILSDSRLLVKDFGHLLITDKINENTLSPDLALYKLYDSTGNLIHSIPHPISWHSLEAGKSFQSGFDYIGDISFFNGSARMSAEDHDTAFMVRGDSILPAYIFHRGNLNPDFNDRYSHPNNRVESKYLTSIVWLYETDEFMFRRYLLNSTDEDYMFRYNKWTGIIDSKDLSTGFMDDLSGGPNIHFHLYRPTNKGDDVWVQVVPAKAFKERYSGGTPPTDSVKRRFYDNRIEVAESISDDDNPVLVLVYLKSSGSTAN